MKKRPTIKDVARKTDLSVSTVSLAINKTGYISEQTRQKVLQAVEELGYHPTHAARGLASRKSGNFGFVLQDDHFSQAEPFYTKIFLGAEFEARTSDYYILLTTVTRECKFKEEIPRFLLERNVDGVIIAGKINERLVQYIDSVGIPLVMVDYELKRRRHSSIMIDNRHGVEMALQHFIDNGRTDIGFVGGDVEHPSIAERFDAFKETLKGQQCAVKEECVVADEPETGIQNGFDAMKRILERGGKPNAVFAANDAMAIGCMQYLKQQEVSIPDDIAIVGFDDIELGTHVEPALTTLRVFKEEMGKLAVQQLVDAVHAKSNALVTVRVPVELIIRGSTNGRPDGHAGTRSATSVLQVS